MSFNYKLKATQLSFVEGTNVHEIVLFFDSQDGTEKRLAIIQLAQGATIESVAVACVDASKLLENFANERK